ncbi:MAG: hypothetical protein OHK0046_30490 [Anaerolineae bacterium]
MPEEGLLARDILLKYPVELHFDETLLKCADTLAAEYELPTAYDAQYLAVAERLACEFCQRMVNSIGQQFRGIRWLGQWKENA